ncbi:Prolyl oligopeptidase family protein [Symmachiella dynata]|uniref:alpha/beta hydrolase family protein n=1 Tax=Symmachiella dynata TaxID=2527995 RepID=UPI00118B0EE6|nr:prolyl oligopeptidase family serine peptidase [Symmachiella dynata]QDT50693.1 Prolyl oligopeptidase family protein [Symmachiella dynata]
MSRVVGVLLALLVVSGFGRADSVCCGEDPLPMLEKISVTSSLDKTPQTSLLWAPETAREQPTPLLIWLHSWSADYRQEASLEYQKQAVRRGWILLLPNFRGPNKRPEACGSKLARTDIIDAMNYVEQHYKVDPQRVYLAGASGGGHMTLLMAGYYPQRFSAVSAWVGITDLPQWYNFHAPDGKPAGYALDILKVLKGKPGESEEIDADYRARSPIHFLHQVSDLHVDIAAGVKDGHTGSVPIAHSLNAFNRIATTNGDDGVSDDEAEQLWTAQKLTAPQASDQVTDETYGREILLRRKSGNARVTIFQGGHEGLPEACCAWLAKQRRATTE